MNWTTDIPKVDGWYWIKSPAKYGGKKEIRFIEETIRKFWNRKGWQFAGRIPSPDDAPKASLNIQGVAHILRKILDEANEAQAKHGNGDELGVYLSVACIKGMAEGALEGINGIGPSSASLNVEQMLKTIVRKLRAADKDLMDGNCFGARASIDNAIGMAVDALGDVATPQPLPAPFGQPPAWMLGSSKEARNALPHSGYRHPMTCGGRRFDVAHQEYAEKHGHSDSGILEATDDGWLCPVCGYTQK